MKMLYIDNRRYIHNAELHIDFISSLEKYGHIKIIGYGKHLKRRLKNTITPTEEPNKQLQKILTAHKPSFILTYNSGGNNVHQYDWVSDFLKTASVPKFHITTDYLRSGMNQEQVDWFSDHGYTGSIFRHKSSVSMPCSVRSHHLPFSVDTVFYNQFSQKQIRAKREMVGFLGTSTIAPKLYFKRIEAMNKLREEGLLYESKFLEKQNRSQMFFGSAYVSFLTKNLFGLTCPGSCNFFTAKHFQIPAAYSMLVCTDVTGLEDFPLDTYIKYDVSNLEKLKEDIIFHIENKKITREKIDALHKYIVKNHSNKIRCKQFKEIILKEIS